MGVIDRASRGVCPIPRCGLEWGLVAATAVSGISLVLFPLTHQLREWLQATSIPSSAYDLVQPSWGSLLLLAAAYQALSLILPRMTQHSAAFAASCANFLVAYWCFRAGITLFAMQGFLYVVGDLYVAIRLRPFSERTLQRYHHHDSPSTR